METPTPDYTVEDIAHFMLCLLIDESKDDITADVIKKLMGAVLDDCSPCFKLQKALIEEVKSYDAPFDEERLK